MGLFDSRLFAWLAPRPAPPPTTTPRQRRPSRRLTRAVAGGRATVNYADELASQFLYVEAPPDAENAWRTLSLDSKTLDNITPARLLDLLIDLSPEVSMGMWTFLRLCNPGYTVRAYQPGTDEIDEAAQAALDEFLDNLHGVYAPPLVVSFDVIINTLFTGAFLRGALLAELVLDEDGRMPVNLVTPDPYLVRFQKIDDPVLGRVFELGQFRDGIFEPLPYETISYTPIDPAPGKPYGRAMVTPALFTSLFLLSLLHDLKRVVMQQGYPRIDVEVDFEALAAMAPPEAQPGTEEFDAWVDATMDEIATAYSLLEPDDAYVHSSVININRPVGTVDSSVLGGIDRLVEKLERMAARAMKLMPLLVGLDYAASDANANRQWEIQAAAIKAIQHLAENALGRLLTLALEAQSIQATVTVRFAELRAAEMLRDAQTEAMTIANAMRKYLNGWTSHEEASLEVTGHAPDAPAPRFVDVIGGQDLINSDFFGGAFIQQDDGDGQERTRLLHEIEDTRARIEEALEVWRVHGTPTAVYRNGRHKEPA